jgi:hypothetical protein
MKRSIKRKINRRNIIKNERNTIYYRKFARIFTKNKFNTNEIQFEWRTKRIKEIGAKAFLVEFKNTTGKHIRLKEIYEA